MPTGEIPAVRRRIDATAEAACRRPGEIRSILNLSIRIDPDAEPQPRDHRFGQARGKPTMGLPDLPDCPRPRRWSSAVTVAEVETVHGRLPD